MVHEPKTLGNLAQFPTGKRHTPELSHVLGDMFHFDAELLGSGALGLSPVRVCRGRLRGAGAGGCELLPGRGRREGGFRVSVSGSVGDLGGRDGSHARPNRSSLSLRLRDMLKRLTTKTGVSSNNISHFGATESESMFCAPQMWAENRGAQ